MTQLPVLSPALGFGVLGGDVPRHAAPADEVLVVPELADVHYQLIVAIVVGGGDSSAFRPHTRDARHPPGMM